MADFLMVLDCLGRRGNNTWQNRNGVD